MNKILLVTHSTLAEGFFNSTKFLSGMTENVEYVNAYIDDSDWTVKVKDYLAKQKDDDHVVVLTDIYGGSVNQKMTLMLNDYNFTLITGVNLPLVLSLALEANPLTKEKCQSLVKEAKDQLKIVEPVKQDNGDENEDDFLG